MFEEEQSFRQPWLWALMTLILLMVVIFANLALAGTAAKPGTDTVPAIG